MDILWIALIAYGISVALYAFRLAQKYFVAFEGQLNNGTIITQAIGAGIIWPVTLLLEGFSGVWEEIRPLKLAPPPQPTPTSFDATAPLPGLEQIVNDAATENLTAGRNPYQ